MTTTELENTVLGELHKASTAYRLQRKIANARAFELLEMVPEPDEHQIRTLDKIMSQHSRTLATGEIPHDAIEYLDSLEHGRWNRTQFLAGIIGGIGIVYLITHVALSFWRGY